jgi:peptidyl-prolyl cis-trans isomerase D
VNESNHYFDLGLTAKDTLPETLQEPVFSATQGTILPPIKTSFGWHIVQIEKIQPARHLPLEEVKNALEAELKTEPAEDKLVETEKKIDDQLAGGAKLAEAGTPFDIKPVTIGPVDATGKRPDGSDDPALKGKTEILQAAFAADEGSAAQMQETKSGDAFAVEVNQVKQPALKDYNLVKDQVEKNVREQEKSNAVSDEAEKLIAEVKKGTSFGTLAKSINVIPVPIGPLARDTKDQAVSPAVNKSLFTLSHVGDVSAVADGDGETLVQLLEIAPPVKSGNDIALVSGSVGSDLQKDITAQYMLALRQKYPVKIHDQVLQQMKAD